MRKHWTEVVKAENVRLQVELRELRMLPMLEEFAERVAQNIMVQLAVTPYDQWPDHARRAFEHESRKSPTIAREYRSRLKAIGQ